MENANRPANLATDQTDTKNALTYFLISDAAGRLVRSYFYSAIAQFPDILFRAQLFPFVQADYRLEEILEQAKEENACILGTFVQSDLDQFAQRYCDEHGIDYLNIMTPIVTQIEQRAGTASTQEPGKKEPLNNSYYEKIKTLEFAVTNDDGKHPEHFNEADIVLLGVSRTGKTPLSIYLAFQGYKVANLPILPESELPKELFTIDKNKIIGLTTDANVLDKFRRERLLSYGVAKDSHDVYSSERRIQRELAYADEVYRKLDCPVINVAQRSIEETATLIALLLDKDVQTYEH